jgi:hypothetical protein
MIMMSTVCIVARHSQELALEPGENLSMQACCWISRGGGFESKASADVLQGVRKYNHFFQPRHRSIE